MTMRMKRGVMLGLAGLLGLGLMMSARGAGGACAEDVVAGVVDAASPLATGKLTTASLGGTLVTVGRGGERLAYLHAGSPDALVRHVAARAGSGVAYVEDRPGADALTLVSPTGVARLLPGGEVTHPAWSERGELAYAVDMSRLELRAADGEVRAFMPPPQAEGVFSPVFLGAETLLAVVQEPVPGTETHDAALDNVWRLELLTGVWSRVTAFEADADRWSIVRTPVERDGEVLFVREHGRARSGGSTFELWRTDGRDATKIRRLPGEMFLAGAGDGLLWNVEQDDEWRLFAEGADGMRLMGCGGIMVDPRGHADPDRRGDDPSEPGAPSGPIVSATGAEAPMGIVVGDFLSVEEARRVAMTIPGSVVVDSADAPSAVAPRVSAVALPLPQGADLDASLAAFRNAHPHLAERSWIASLNG